MDRADAIADVMYKYMTLSIPPPRPRAVLRPSPGGGPHAPRGATGFHRRRAGARAMPLLHSGCATQTEEELIQGVIVGGRFKEH